MTQVKKIIKNFICEKFLDRDPVRPQKELEGAVYKFRRNNVIFGGERGRNRVIDQRS